MSYSTTDGALKVDDVEAFVYHDPSGNTPNYGTAGPSESSSQPAAKPSDRTPRISEQELSRLLADARAEGMREGEKGAQVSFAEALAQERKRVTEAVSAFLQQQTEYYSRVEVELVHFALAIAARILHREAQVDRTVVAGLVRVMVEKLQQGSRVMVRVRPEEAGAWRHYFHDNAEVQVMEDSSLEARNCILETELGTTEMGLDAQLKEIEKGFADLLAQRPEPK
ncbi:MAG TPA: FliH/SctL family protein [Terriglobales bacterium]|nr:FliH/SctL family protein [Terriglobales bacterium]